MDSQQLLIDNLLKSGIVIPPQPAVLIEMEQLLGKPHTQINTIAKLVAKDAGISAMVFKVISSPAYGMGKQVDSLEKAISVMGLTQMANIVKSVACASLWAATRNSMSYSGSIPEKLHSLLQP